MRNQKTKEAENSWLQPGFAHQSETNLPSCGYLGARPDGTFWGHVYGCVKSHYKVKFPNIS